MPSFESAWFDTDHFEGGYSLDPTDPGGETYRGISRKNNPKWYGWDIIDKTKSSPDFPKSLDHKEKLADAVRDFYLAKWKRLYCDQMVTQELAQELFDTAVNLGEATAVKFLQAALNCLNRNESLWPDLTVDGALGVKTLACLGEAHNDEILISKLINNQQACYYMEAMKKNPELERFARGWFEKRT